MVEDVNLQPLKKGDLSEWLNPDVSGRLKIGSKVCIRRN